MIVDRFNGVSGGKLMLGVALMTEDGPEEP